LIDLQAPVIVLETPKPGAYIRGTTTFTGYASDDNEIESLWFQLYNYQEKTLSGYSRLDYGEHGIFYKITDYTGDAKRYDFKFKIDTRQFPDGDFILRLRAVDAVGKEVITNEYLFYIKNDRPDIRMNIPSITDGDVFPGDIRSDFLNFSYLDDTFIVPGDTTPLFDQFNFSARVLDTKSFMSGSITDSKGIYREPENKAAGLYPPQIRFWQVNIGTPLPTKDPNGVTRIVYDIDNPPDEDQVPWEPLYNEEIGVNDLQFRYDLTDVSGQYFLFEIRAQSTDDEHTSVRYPRDYYNFAGVTSVNPNFQAENIYVLIYVREPLEYPTLELYQLQDIYGEKDPGTGLGGYAGLDIYNDIPTISAQDKADGNYPYITKPTPNYRSGAFTLRMKASHSGGIKSAEVFWEKDDKSARGRFIWDPADTQPYPAWPATNVVSTSNYYSMWGYRDPNISRGGMVRSFVFTYDDNPAKDTNPVTPDAAVSGKSQVQQYTGTAVADPGGLLFDKLYDNPAERANWQDYTLTDGTYNLYIYATSNSNTRSPSPFYASVSIDRQSPEIELNEIEGRASERGTDITVNGVKIQNTTLVNGVIRPRFVMADSRPVDTGFRTPKIQAAPDDDETKYYFHDGSRLRSEQAYILIPKNQENALEAYLISSPWPFPSGSAPFSIPGVSVSKHGPVFDSVCKFLTSNNYSSAASPLEPGTSTSDRDKALDDGEYLLYAFARDNAFNVNRKSFPIYIQYESDAPVFTFEGVSSVYPDVDKPDSGYDFGGSDYDTDPDKSFIIKGGAIHNKFNANSSIRVKIRDDDRLARGVQGGADSQIEVTIIGSTVISEKIAAWDDTKLLGTSADPGYLVTLTTTDMKNVFATMPQPNSQNDLKPKIDEITGTITQTMLLDGLKNNIKYNSIFGAAPGETVSPSIPPDSPKHDFDSLPDGIYRIRITIKDDPIFKLSMDPSWPLDTPPLNNPAPTYTNPPYALQKTTTEEFWIAVDTKKPEITVDPYSSTNTYGTRPSGDFIAGSTSYLQGWVEDENGPITFTYRVLDGTTVLDGPNAPKLIPVTDTAAVPPYTNGMTAGAYISNKWKYGFRFNINMNLNKAGIFTFEITFKDRFGNEQILSRKYSVDNVRPKVTLTRPIETFARDKADVTLTGGNVSGDTLNKARLAVKTVSFTVSATDNFKVAGIRWWLLPTNVGSGTGAFDSSREVTDYNAFPAKLFEAVPPATPNYGVYYSSGVYNNVGTPPSPAPTPPAGPTARPPATPTGPYSDISSIPGVSGFDQGAYGFVDINTKPYTVFIDSERLAVPNGEYRLHIIAIDDAGNESRLVPDDPDPDLTPTSNIYQEVFFLQKEDRPYFELETFGPGYEVNDPEAATNKDVLGGPFTLRGTILENNGFLRPSPDSDKFWTDSVLVWFDGTGNNTTIPTTVLDSLDTGNPDLSSYGFEGPVRIPLNLAESNPTGYGLIRQGRNLNLNINLQNRFPNGFTKDGTKRYIVKAVDSPVNKLNSDYGTALGTGGPNEPPAGHAHDAYRVNRWKQFVFTADTVPPVVKITAPPQGSKFGSDYDTKFVLEGSIEDANLKKLNGEFYIEYFLDGKITESTPFILTNYITNTADPAYPTKVEFKIPASDVSTMIIPKAVFNALTEGQHTLTIFAFDLSEKRGSDTLNFIKDTVPPGITFPGFDAGSRVYDENNPSRVDGTGTPWWPASGIDNTNYRNNWLKTNPITTIYYDSGLPTLIVEASDIVSEIDISNNPLTCFKYWIDREYQLQLGSPRTQYVTRDGTGQTIRWTINLTANSATSGLPLGDGVHTIVVEAADTNGGVNNGHYMIAFRIDSKRPTAEIKNKTALGSTAVFGKLDQYTNENMADINLEAADANLKEVVLTVGVQGSPPDTIKTIKYEDVSAGAPTAWIYTPFGYPPTPPNFTSTAEDKVEYIGTYPITKSMFNKAGNYEAIIKAKDYAGNESDEDVWTFIYDPVSPEIIFTNPDKPNAADDLKPEDLIDLTDLSLAGVPSAGYINRLSSQNLRIQGFVKDSLSAVRAVDSQIEKWNWQSGKWEIIEVWTPVRTDIASNTLLEISWTKNLLGQDPAGGTGSGLNISKPSTWTGGQSTDPDISPEGLYRIQIRAKDSSTTQNGTNTWNMTTDYGNPLISPYVYFYYDRTDPELEITKINGLQDIQETYYSAKLMNGFTFEGTVTDNNRFAKVEVTMEKDNAPQGYPIKADLENDTWPGTPDLNTGESVQKWNVSFDMADYPDGRYRISITAYDMMGRSKKIVKSFILDNTPPGAEFTLPGKDKNETGHGEDIDRKTNNPNKDFASERVEGGKASVITGETWDKSPNGSESGIDQMWYRLGYIDNSSVFPTEGEIKDDEDRLIKLLYSRLDLYPGRNLVTNPLNVKERNKVLDAVAGYRAASDADSIGNSWFKLGGKVPDNFGTDIQAPLPTGFIIDNPNIYDWRMEIPDKYLKSKGNLTDLTATPGVQLTTDPKGDYYQIGGLKLYCNNIYIKGRLYEVGNSAARQMVRAVDNKAGIFRLPLWIRLVDRVGNVSYYCHDIWIYPDGDIPWTSIDNLSNGSKDSARGGTISVDGVAHSNTSVYDVIFRVFADGEPNTDLDGKVLGSIPLDANLVKIPGYDMVTASDSGIIDRLPKTSTPASSSRDFSKPDDSWQHASLTMKGGAGEPLIPWTIMLNADDEIKRLIDTRGFASGSSGKDMIRVWLEIFVFNGEGGPIRSSINRNPDPNDTSTTAQTIYGDSNNKGQIYWELNKPNPKPYVRVFYIKSSAPQITHPNVGDWNGSSFDWNPELPANPGGGGYKGAGTETRRDKFALKAILDPNPSNTSGAGLGEVNFRIKLDGGLWSAWASPPLWTAGPPATGLPLESNGVKISVRDTTGNRVRYDFEYDIDSKISAHTTNWAAVNNGAWEFSGGTVTVQIRIKDNASPPNEAEQTIQIAVDNFAPVADKNHKTNPKVAGSNVDFMGRVYDYATAPPSDAMPADPAVSASAYKPKKVDRVIAWFTKGSGTGLRYVNINTGAMLAAPPNPRTMNVLNGREANVVYNPTTDRFSDMITSITLTNRGTAGSVTLPQMASGESGHNAEWVRELSESTATPGTRMLWAPVNSSVYDIRWSFTVDSTKLPDGDLTLNYIVIDAAGNASYYKQETSVRNKYPQIDKITLYTDNNGQGAAYTQEASKEYILNDYRSQMFNNMVTSANIKTTGYLNSGFISKNQYIGFKVEATKGNRALNFRLQHVKRELVSLNNNPISVTNPYNMQSLVDDRDDPSKINLYTIAFHGDYSIANWKALGVHEDNPSIGTHFVLQLSSIPSDFKYSTTAQVWKYTAVVTAMDPPNGTKDYFTPNTDANKPDTTGTVEIGDPSKTPREKFEFLGSETNTFAPGTPAAGDTKIREFDGSHPDADDALYPGNPDDTAFFLIRVWDTVGGEENKPTPVTEAWINDQLYDAVVVGMNVYQTDKTPPVARLYDLNPYTETAVTNDINATIRNAADPQFIGSNIVRGGLFNNGTVRNLIRSGYIDPRNQSTYRDPVNSNGVALPDYQLRVSGDTVTTGNTRDKVSGRVILRGWAWDDQLIDEIRIKLGSGAENTILKLNASGVMEAVYPGRADAPLGAADYRNSAFVVEELHWKTGHTVEWAYIWDTGAGPANNFQIQVIVKDKKSAAGLTSAPVPVAQEAGTKFHNQVDVDIVPYITGFQRETPKFSTKRSLQGWYSFYRGELNIKVLGYNFGTGTASMTLNGATITPSGSSPTERTFSIPNNGASGAITMTTSGEPAYNNNSSTTGKSWNWESNAYTPGSDLWMNKPHAHIWRSVEEVGGGTTAGTVFASLSDANKTNMLGLTSPGMALQYSGPDAGKLHGVWSAPKIDSVFNARNDGTIQQLKLCGEPYDYTDIDYFNANNNNWQNENTSVAMSYQRDGGPRLVLKPTMKYDNYGGSDDQGFVIARGINPSSTDRWQHTRIRKAAASNGANNPGRVFVTAYDAYYKRLFFTSHGGSNLTEGTYDDTIPNANNNEWYLDGGGNNTVPNGRPAVGTAVANNNDYGTIDRSTSAGQWSAVDYDSGGYPVVAYYDEANNTLRLAYAANATPNPGNANNWTRRYVLQVGHALRRGSGEYVSMKIDRNNNNIHLAFYNSVYKTVVYAVGTKTGEFKAYAIDRVVEGGQWTDISVDTGGNPWITYADATRKKLRDGVRIAYKSSGAGTTFTRTLADPIVSGQSITGWEALTMPADYEVNDDRLNIAAWPPTGSTAAADSASPIGGWHAAVGYGSSLYRIGYFFKPTVPTGF
jgi:hypothetical protein